VAKVLMVAGPLETVARELLGWNPPEEGKSLLRHQNVPACLQLLTCQELGPSLLPYLHPPPHRCHGSDRFHGLFSLTDQLLASLASTGDPFPWEILLWGVHNLFPFLAALPGGEGQQQGGAAEERFPFMELGQMLGKALKEKKTVTKERQQRELLYWTNGSASIFRGITALLTLTFRLSFPHGLPASPLLSSLAEGLEENALLFSYLLSLPELHFPTLSVHVEMLLGMLIRSPGVEEKIINSLLRYLGAMVTAPKALQCVLLANPFPSLTPFFKRGSTKNRYNACIALQAILENLEEHYRMETLGEIFRATGLELILPILDDVLRFPPSLEPGKESEPSKEREKKREEAMRMIVTSLDTLKIAFRIEASLLRRAIQAKKSPLPVLCELSVSLLPFFPSFFPSFLPSFLPSFFLFDL
jgi:hypothetical protein